MNPKIFIMFSLLFVHVFSIMVDEEPKAFSIFKRFQKFIKKYNKQYGSIEEFKTRFDIFRSNFQQSLKLNSASRLLRNESGSSAIYGITKFSDLTKEEFQLKFTGLKVEDKPQKFYESKVVNDPLPDKFDWRDHGAVSKVKNQFNCGSCWAFSVTGNLEGVNFVKTKKMQLLSEQQLVSCDGTNYGCRGGYMENAYKYLLKVGGIESDGYYYVGFEDECLFEKDKVVVSISDYVFDKTSDYNEIKKMLINNAPLSIGLNSYYLHSYKSGVIDTISGDECPTQVDHAVLLVGFGVESGKEYWIVKNSWGADWGEQGFFRIANKEGICGINSYVSTSIIN